LTFHRCRLGLQGFPVLAVPYNRGRSYGTTLYTFISPSECDSIRADRLAWASLPLLCDLLFEDSRHPATDISRPASTPSNRSCLWQSATKPTTRSVLVVSHHFDGLLRERAVSLLRLTTSQGFATFRQSGLQNNQPKPVDGRSERFPRSVFHTLRRIPFASSRSVSPQPLPSCCYRLRTTPKSHT